MQHHAERFLRSWRRSAHFALWFDNSGGRSTLDLQITGLTAADREALLLKGRAWGLRGVAHAADGTPIAWLSRTITTPRTTVHAWLGHHIDGTARCVRFFRQWPGVPHPAPSADPAPFRINSSPVFIECPFDRLGLTAPIAIEGHQGLNANSLFSTTDQDESNRNRLDLALRAHTGLPFPEDLVDLLLEHQPTIDIEHLAAVFGFTPQRWDRLVMGAWPSAAEVARLRTFPDRKALYRVLVDRYPHRYGFQPAPDPTKPWSDLALRLNTSEPYPLAPAGHDRDAFSGFRRFSVDRFAQLANHLAYRGNPTIQRLWAALFCADAIAVHVYGIGFTGMRYRWTPLGPVPDQAAQRLALLCDRNIIRLSPAGAHRATRTTRVSPHPLFYPPDYPIYWQAQEVEQLLPTDWPRMGFVRYLAPRVRQGSASGSSGPWLHLLVPDLVGPQKPMRSSPSPLPEAIALLGRDRLMRFFQAVARTPQGYPATLLLRDLAVGSTVEEYFFRRSEGHSYRPLTELKVVPLSPRVFLITYGVHDPGSARGSVWRVTFSPAGQVSRLQEQGFWIH